MVYQVLSVSWCCCGVVRPAARPLERKETRRQFYFVTSGYPEGLPRRSGYSSCVVHVSPRKLIQRMLIPLIKGVAEDVAVFDDDIADVPGRMRDQQGRTSSLLTRRWREMDSNLYGAFPVK